MLEGCKKSKLLYLQKELNMQRKEFFPVNDLHLLKAIYKSNITEYEMFHLALKLKKYEICSSFKLLGWCWC